MFSPKIVQERLQRSVGVFYHSFRHSGQRIDMGLLVLVLVKWFFDDTGHEDKSRHKSRDTLNGEHRIGSSVFLDR